MFLSPEAEQALRDDEERSKVIDIQTRAPVAKAEGVITLESLFAPAIEQSERRRAGIDRPVPLPFPELAEIYGGGLWPGVHIEIGGTGTGKTARSLQTSLHAARAGVPVCYVGLELDEAQVATRILSEHAGVGWSGVYLGRCTERDLERAREAVPTLGSLPFYVDFGSSFGWPASRLPKLAEQLRAKHPDGPVLFVVDFLQLVGAEADESGKRLELRERIAQASYMARECARKYGVSVQLISSSARNNYGTLAGDLKEAGLSITPMPKAYEGKAKTIKRPDVLVGLGKESGEIEFAADSVTTLIKLSEPLDNGESVVIAAVPKVRCGPARWCALTFNGYRFAPYPVESLEDLPSAPGRGQGGGEPGRPAVQGDDYVERVVATLGRIGPVQSKRQIVERTDGNAKALYSAIKTAMVMGRIQRTEDGFSVAASGNVEAKGDESE